MKYLAKSLVVLLIVTCAWRYGRESVRAWLGNATRAPLGPVASSVELPAGEHYSPAEDLERLDYQAIRSARRSVDIAMFSFTDVLLAQAVREAGRRGIQVRVYRDETSTTGNKPRRAGIPRQRRHSSERQTFASASSLPAEITCI